MKRFLFFIMPVCFSANNCFSQQGSSISISIGPAFPVGEFANKNGYSSKSGLAATGALLDLSYMHKTRHSDFGFIATLRARVNPNSEKATVAPFAAQYPDYDWSVTKKPWEAAAAMVGGYHRCKAAKKLYLEEALLFGAAEALLPGNTVTGIQYGGTGQPIENLFLASIAKRYATTFSGMVKLGGGYPLTRRLDLLAQLDFWYMAPTFKNVTQVTVMASGFASPGLYSLQDAASIQVAEYTRSNYTQQMNSINFTIGISLRLF